MLQWFQYRGKYKCTGDTGNAWPGTIIGKPIHHSIFINMYILEYSLASVFCESCAPARGTSCIDYIVCNFNNNQVKLNNNPFFNHRPFWAEMKVQIINLKRKHQFHLRIKYKKNIFKGKYWDVFTILRLNWQAHGVEWKVYCEHWLFSE